jgi:branched-chain amino acid transport system permease protein
MRVVAADFRALATLVAAAIVLSLIPYFGTRGQVVLATEFCAVLAITLAWNLLAGFAGLVLIGHALFIGIGGYTLYLFANGLGIPPYPAIIAAAFMAGLVALALSPILFRLKGAQLAIGSWVLAEIARILVLQSQALGAGGGLNLEVIKLVPRAMRLTANYTAAASVLMIALIAIFIFMKSRYGLALRAMRDSEAAAEAMGVDIRHIRLFALVFAAAITGAAGAAFYIPSLQITPGSAFSINWMAIVIFATILGGIGTLEGPIIGAIVYFVCRETLSSSGPPYFIATGVFAIAVTLFMPGGLWGLVRRTLRFDLLGVTHTNGRKERPLVPFLNFRFFK